jgi:hypothetical protein
MSLNELYLLAKNLRYTKENKNFFREGIEIVYHLDRVEHEFLQQECYAKIKNTLTGYECQKIFELSLFDIKFVFKRLPG